MDTSCARVEVAKLVKATNVRISDRMRRILVFIEYFFAAGMRGKTSL